MEEWLITYSNWRNFFLVITTDWKKC